MTIPINRPGILSDDDEWTLPNGPNPLAINNLIVGLDDAPSGAAFVFRVQDVTGASPTNYIELSIADGVKTGSIAGTLSIAADADMYFRVVTASSAAWLNGYLTSDVEAPTGTDLVSLTLLKRYLGIAGSDNDTLLTELVYSVSGKIQAFIGHTIVSTVYTDEAHSVNGGYNVLILKHGPIISISDISIDDDTVDSGEYEFDLDGRLVTRLAANWPKGVRNIKVDYTAGYASVPYELQEAARVQAAYEFKRSQPGGDRLGEASRDMEAGGSSAFPQDDWAPGVKPIILKYRQF